MTVNLQKIKKVYFIGIGGIGISATAGILHSRGFTIYGSDAQENDITTDLRHGDLKIFIPHDAENITADIDLVVYSVAVPEDNPERVRARELNIPEITYPQLLGEMLKGKYAIGISGTDGKTTTTAMIAKIMIDAGRDPAVVLGSQAEFLWGNWRSSDNNYFIFEADEYRRAFDNYNPQAVVITNVGVDHLDYYQDADDYLATFKKYLNKIPADGLAVINNDDLRSVEAVKNCQAKKITYGINSSADYLASEIKILNGRQEFSILENGEVAARVNIGLPGNYNISNALAAIAFCRQEKIDWPTIVESLAGFKGTWRRFELLGEVNGVKIITDYAHTPGGLEKVIQATKDFYANQKILFVFQPHQYSRTKNFFDGFVSALKTAENAMVVDIFYVNGRENPADFDINSKILAESAGVEYGGDLLTAKEKIRSRISEFNVIMLIGAGDIYSLAKKIATQ